MSQTISPPLPFERARKRRRTISMIFTIAFWCMLLMAIAMMTAIPTLDRQMVVGPFQIAVGPPHAKLMPFGEFAVSLDGFSFGQRTFVMLAIEMVMLPLLFMMHHTRRIFGHFAKEEFFIAPVVGHIRRLSVWLIAYFFANIAAQIALQAMDLMPPGPYHGTILPLLIGTVTRIIIKEGRRIADDNASIV